MSTHREVKKMKGTSKENFSKQSSFKKEESGSSYFRIIHLDAGRKYFSPGNIRTILDIAAAAGYNQLEFYFSDNQGFRLSLDDLTVVTPAGHSYDLTPALGDGYAYNNHHPDYSGRYLTQAEMDELIDYAGELGIEIVPCMETPGHMGAILEQFPQFCYQQSRSAIDLENPEAVRFALAVVDRYAEYFASRGIRYFNIGADEFANDLPDMGFEGLHNQGRYQLFVDYLNAAADVVIRRGLTPRAFNDGIYYKNDTAVSINKAIQVCYWSSGWCGYHLAPAALIAQQGHELINTNGDYYWVLGGTECTPEKAAQFSDTVYPGGTAPKPAGSMFCIWCDTADADGADGGDGVVKRAADAITAFGNAMKG